MGPMKPWRLWSSGGFVSVTCAVVLGASVAALAQIKPPPPKPNQLQVYLVRMDTPDCLNGNVPSADGPLVGGNIWLVRQANGNTDVKVALTGTPDTTYNFYLKCVRQLGNITTDDDGVAVANFSFPTNAVGNTYGFDSYPQGSPAGNKFESAQVNFK